jgi:hypothetical protein
VDDLALEHPAALVGRPQRVPVRVDAERVPGDEHAARPLLKPHVEQHPDEAHDGVDGRAVGAGHGLRRRVVGAMSEVVAVDDQERSGRILRLHAGHDGTPARTRPARCTYVPGPRSQQRCRCR